MKKFSLVLLSGLFIVICTEPFAFCEPCEGDFNTDGDVDGLGLAVFGEDFGRTDCPMQ